MKITNPRRFISALVILTFLAFAGFEHMLKDYFKVVGEKEVVVVKGDTIWSLIHKYNNADVLNAGDIRETIDHFDKLNGHLKSLKEGDVVEVPILALND